MTEPLAPASSPGLQFRVLNDEQLARLYGGVLTCLERTGVNVLNAAGRELCAAAGARVDGLRVRFPAALVERALSTCRRGYDLWGRDGAHRLPMLPGETHFGPGPTTSYFLDPYTGERRRSLRADVGLTARLVDALPNFDYVMGLALADDVPAERASVFEFAEMLANSVKPLLGWAESRQNIEDIYRMAVAAVGGEAELRAHPICALFAVGMAPLIVPDATLDAMLWAAGRGLPIVYHGPGVGGVSAPVTGAGTLVVNTAGSLAGLVILQLAHPGAPVCLGAVPSPMDPRTGRPSYGSPELSLYSAAIAEIARYLDLPYMGTAGASEAKSVDLQAAVESTIQVVFSLLSGTTLPHDAGFLDCADIGSLEMLALTDEIIALSRRLLRGIEISDATLMLDQIDEVGPGGQYIDRSDTAHLFRREIWQPRLFNRQPWNAWEAAGSSTIGARLNARVRTLLETHTVPPLAEDARRAIQQILVP